MTWFPRLRLSREIRVLQRRKIALLRETTELAWDLKYKFSDNLHAIETAGLRARIKFLEGLLMFQASTKGKT